MTTSRPRLLLVDDDEAIRANLSPFLERAGFDVTTAVDGMHALELFTAQPPDLVVLDVLMPHLDGREVLRRIRSGGTWTPVLLLTEVGESFERAAALEEGADDYLNKPFDPQELVARIRAILRRSLAGMPPLAASQVLVAGTLRLERVARRAWVEGTEVVLTPKAYALLEYLMNHPGEAVTRQQLLSIVWGYDFPVGGRAVDNRIAELRRALGDDLIATVQGSGYRLAREVGRG